MEDKMGIYREEALLMLGMLADVKSGVYEILDYIEGGDDDEEEAEEVPDP